MWQRIKAIWELSKLPDSVIEKIKPVQEITDSMYQDIIDNLGPINLNGVFMPDMTEEELEQYEKEQKGWNMKDFLSNFNKKD